MCPAQCLAKRGQGRRGGLGRTAGEEPEDPPTMCQGQQHSHSAGPTHPLYSSKATTQQRKFQFSLDFHVPASRKIATMGFVA